MFKYLLTCYTEYVKSLNWTIKEATGSVLDIFNLMLYGDNCTNMYEIVREYFSNIYIIKSQTSNLSNLDIPVNIIVYFVKGIRQQEKFPKLHWSWSFIFCTNSKGSSYKRFSLSLPLSVRGRKRRRDNQERWKHNLWD